MTETVMNRDKRYGWVIVTAFFILGVLEDGVRFSFGIFFVEFLSQFNRSKAATAWVGAIMMGVYNLSGPVFAVIVNKIGYRKASMLGSIIATAGFLLSYFASSLYHLYLTFGILQGFGYGLAYLAGIVAVSQYFYKRRSLALGISFCGNSVGTFIMPPILRYLLETYTWRGTMLIIAGMSLNGCVLSSFYRPIRRRKENVNSGNDENALNSDNDKNSLMDYNTEGDQTYQKDATKNKNGSIPNEVNSPPFLNSTFCSYQNEHDRQTCGDSISNTVNEIDKEQLLDLKENACHDTNKNHNRKVLSKGVRSSLTSLKKEVEGHLIPRLPSLSLQSISITNAIHPNGKQFKLSVIEHIFPRVLVTNVNFIIFMMSTVFIGITAYVPYSMLPDYAILSGATPQQSAWLVSAIGIGGIASRVGAGLLSDMTCVNRLLLLGTCILSIGVSTVMVALVARYEIFVSYSVLYGIFVGAIYVVQPIVLLEYFGEQYIGEVVGVTWSIYGVSGFIGTPMAGWLFDTTGSYQVSFLTTGICYLIGGIINFFVLCTKANIKEKPSENLELQQLKSENVVL